MVLHRGLVGGYGPRTKLAFTAEEGHPLTRSERALMPAADTAWPMPLAELMSCLHREGFRVLWQQDCAQTTPRSVRRARAATGRVE